MWPSSCSINNPLHLSNLWIILKLMEIWCILNKVRWTLQNISWYFAYNVMLVNPKYTIYRCCSMMHSHQNASHIMRPLEDIDLNNTSQITWLHSHFKFLAILDQISIQNMTHCICFCEVNILFWQRLPLFANYPGGIYAGCW